MKPIIAFAAMMLAAGSVVGQAAQPLVSVPGGEFTMGDSRLIDKGFVGENIKYTPVRFDSHHVTISPFQVSEFPVTVDEFSRFVLDAGLETRGYLDYRAFNKKRFGMAVTSKEYWDRMLSKYKQYPAEATFMEALSFCDWLGKRDGKRYRLPTEAEWEYAATGGRTQRYPWGTEYKRLEDENSPLWDPDRYSYPIGTFAADESSFGVRDVYGNTAEWTMDCFDPEAYVRLEARSNPVCLSYRQGPLRISVRKVNGNYRIEDDSFGVKFRAGQGIREKHAFRIVHIDEPQSRLNADTKWPLDYKFRILDAKPGTELLLSDSPAGKVVTRHRCVAGETVVSYLEGFPKDSDAQVWRFIVSSEQVAGWLLATSEH